MLLIMGIKKLPNFITCTIVMLINSDEVIQEYCKLASVMKHIFFFLQDNIMSTFDLIQHVKQYELNILQQTVLLQTLTRLCGSRRNIILLILYGGPSTRDSRLSGWCQPYSLFCPPVTPTTYLSTYLTCLSAILKWKFVFPIYLPHLSLGCLSVCRIYQHNLIFSLYSISCRI